MGQRQCGWRIERFDGACGVRSVRGVLRRPAIKINVKRLVDYGGIKQKADGRRLFGYSPVLRQPLLNAGVAVRRPFDWLISSKPALRVWCPGRDSNPHDVTR